MTKQETIQVLKSIEDRAIDFPNMTECDWVAIAAARRHLTEEPVSEDLMSKIKKFTDNYFPIIDNGINIPARNELRDIFSEAARMVAQWQREKYLSNIDIDAIWGELVCRGVERLSRADVEEFVERLKEGKYDKGTD